MQSARFDGERVASQLNGASWFFQTRLRSNVLSRLKSGPDYTRLSLITMENMKFGAWVDRDAQSVWVPPQPHGSVTLGKSQIS
jgi:hypothetical protein